MYLSFWDPCLNKSLGGSALHIKPTAEPNMHVRSRVIFGVIKIDGEFLSGDISVQSLLEGDKIRLLLRSKHGNLAYGAIDTI